MRCRKGDIAIVVGGRLNLGKSVTCRELRSVDSLRALLPGQPDPSMGPLWLIDRPITWGVEGLANTFELWLVPDRLLMPIRPDAEDGSTETTELEGVAQ